ncbi:SUMF1/EgtB/PvdO family nonheme iron enzyme [Dethiosulfatarculus sandiegensis]|nr:SUMF1/EgtB/PvdO family nonheme iron enzyme [Dethiosulfatarculus sandiegensis]
MASEHKRATLLHLSDLHIRNNAEETLDRSMVLDPLLERIKYDYSKGLRPELVLISGDIAFKGIKEEYDLALPFFKKLLGVLHLKNDRLYIAPGNHDLNRKVYRPSEIPAYNTNREINEELANCDYRADLLKGMRDYFDFIQTNFPHMTSEHGDLVPFVGRIKMNCGIYLGLVGLNSAWMCRARKNDESDSGQIAIGQHQIKSAFAELEGKGEIQATVAMFHHPLGWLAPMDRRICETYLDRTIVLTGHLHEPGGGYFNGFKTQTARIQAGGAYLGSPTDWPSRYHYIGIDLKRQSLRLDFRAFSKAKGEWFVDAETGDDGGGAEIPVNFLGLEKTATASTGPVHALPEFPRLYAAWLHENFRHLDAKGLNPSGNAIPLRLPEIFIPLYGADLAKVEQKLEHPERLKSQTHGGRRGNPPDEPRKVEIEILAARNNALLISGQAGCGKSTLLKHLAYTISPRSDKEPASPELAEYLPVLIQLKDLKAYCSKDRKDLERTRSVGDGIVEWYLKNKFNGNLTLADVHEFAKCGRLMLLIDGLDEIDQPLRDYAVNALADLRLPHAENKIVLAGRPHGLDGAPGSRFADFKTSVEELEAEQINLFIRKWFDIFYQGTTGLGKKTADDLLGDIKAHPALEKLSESPLMLTAICLLYYDEKELPNQRAELLKKFIDNLIARRFDDRESVLIYLKTLAHDMHQKRVRVLDREPAIMAMTKDLPALPGEKDPEFKLRKERLFKYIEPRCGLLLERAGQTEFWHLLFQEFLTAQMLMNISEDKHAAISDFWNDDWYEEVIELYVSYLSIDNPATANSIIDDVIQADDESPYRAWRLAARCLVDFHKSRQNPGLIQATRERLKLIIQKPLEAATLNDAGASLGWLGDDRDLESFSPVHGGEYELEDIGKRTMEAFEIGRYPVTNQFFKKFIKAKGYESKAYWTEQGLKWLETKQATRPETWSERKYSCPNQPVTGVSWYEATAFCNWLNATDSKHYYFLPSAEQWQAAAAGKEQRKFPWGDNSPTGRCNIYENKIGSPSPVGIFAGGRTPGNKDDAIFDLAGNVWEWTSSLWVSARDSYVIKGGSWSGSAEYARCADRVSYDPDDRDDDVGFRCARTLK